MFFINKSVKRKIAVPSIIGGVAICLSVLISSHFTEKEIVLESGLKMADLVVKQSSEMRKLYAGKIMPKIQQLGGYDHAEWENKEGAVPAAATLVNMVGHNIAQALPGVSLRLFSEHPFKNRTLTLDDFEKRTLEALKKDSSKPYYELIEKPDGDYLMYALPDIMGENCVKCHNSHSLSPKTDWVVGDLRGAVSVTLPVSSLQDAIFKQFNILQAVLIGILSLMLISLLFVAKSIVKDASFLQNRLNDFFDYLNGKKTTMKIIEMKNQDEFGQMSKILNQNILHIKDSLENDMKVIGETVIVSDKVEKGIFSSRIYSKTNNPMINTFTKTFNKMLEQTEANILNVKATLESYIKNDYTQKINIDSEVQEDMLAVMESVNKLGDTLKANALLSLENGDVLNKNASYMSKSVSNVATKANQQAASLEETAAALEEILSITRNTTETTAKMTMLSGEVNASVNSSRELAIKTASAMDNINNQIKEINEAISVIDKIAFQTNILSLNAAVEAATAGESGKGFAVVAAEVRNLANRSAEAAKEITKIVENATKKANEGKDISNEMIDGYEKLSSNINETIKLIENVSIGSKEQMQGIEQINDAVNVLDRVTQENASEADRVSQIANEIKEMADVLAVEAKSKKIK